MRYASYFSDGVAGVGEVRDDTVYPLVGVSEVGSGTPAELLARAERSVTGLQLADVELRPSVPRPGKVFCVGLNYLTHVEETKRDLSEYPVLFPKYDTSLLSARDDLVLPPESSQVDFEGELAVVIGAPGRRISEDQAMEHVLGYSVANDITMRDFQYKTHQWMQGKAWDASTPLGPYLVTPDEVDLDTAWLRTVLNGVTVQESQLTFIFSIQRLIAVISAFVELRTGDVILTGTPSGVGFRRDPQLFLKAGDQITVSVDGVGAITTNVAQ